MAMFSTDESPDVRPTKPDPTIAIMYEQPIMSCCFFLCLDSTLFLIVGGLATRWFSTLYLGPLAAVLSLFSAGILLLLHKAKDEWRRTLHANLYDHVYPPCATMLSICANIVIVIVWYAGTFVTSVYHALLREGKLNDVIAVKRSHGPVSSWGELIFMVLCSFITTLLLVFQIMQRRVASQEMRKALLSGELEY